MQPPVKLHLPLITTRIEFELNTLPPPPIITARMNLAKAIRRNRRGVQSPYAKQDAPFSHELRASTPMNLSGSRESSPLTDLGDDDDPDDEPVPQPLPLQNQIPKPPGEAGRSNCGGFNLERALHWEGNKYRRMMNYVNDMIKERLDANQCFTNQDQNVLAELIQTAAEKFKIQHQYIRDWPIREAFKQRLKYHSEMGKKRAHREAGDALKQAAIASSKFAMSKQRS